MGQIICLDDVLYSQLSSAWGGTTFCKRFLLQLIIILDNNDPSITAKSVFNISLLGTKQTHMLDIATFLLTTMEETFRLERGGNFLVSGVLCSDAKYHQNQ